MSRRTDRRPTRGRSTGQFVRCGERGEGTPDIAGEPPTRDTGFDAKLAWSVRKQGGWVTEARGKPRILVVDDDAALSEMLQIVLRQEGFDTVRCSSGEVALHEFRQSRPDLVLLDLMLPGRDGVAVCRDIRAESGVPIIMLTAKSDTADVAADERGGRRGHPRHRGPDDLRVVTRRPTRRKPALADTAGVRPPPGAGEASHPCLHEGGAAGRGVGVPELGGHPPGQRPCPKAPGEGREGSGEPGDRDHGQRDRVQGR